MSGWARCDKCNGAGEFPNGDPCGACGEIGFHLPTPAPLPSPAGETATPRTNAIAQRYIESGDSKGKPYFASHIDADKVRDMEQEYIGELARVTAERDEEIIRMRDVRMALFGDTEQWRHCPTAIIERERVAREAVMHRNAYKQENDSLRAQLEEAAYERHIIGDKLDSAEEAFAAAQARIAELEATVARLTTTIQNNPNT